jgi:hypothetical protein
MTPSFKGWAAQWRYPGLTSIKTGYTYYGDDGGFIGVDWINGCAVDQLFHKVRCSWEKDTIPTRVQVKLISPAGKAHLFYGYSKHAAPWLKDVLLGGVEHHWLDVSNMT